MSLTIVSLVLVIISSVLLIIHKEAFALAREGIQN